MSNRFYPFFVKGNPQLRVFLPDYKMVMVKSKSKMPENVVAFKVDPRMTDWDIKNYLEKIYKVKVAAVNSHIYPGELYMSQKSLAKREDFKIAHVYLPIGQKFVWPNLFPKEEQETDIEEKKKIAAEVNKNRQVDPSQPNKPVWFI